MRHTTGGEYSPAGASAAVRGTRLSNLSNTGHDNARPPPVRAPSCAPPNSVSPVLPVPQLAAGRRIDSYSTYFLPADAAGVLRVTAQQRAEFAAAGTTLPTPLGSYSAAASTPARQVYQGGAQCRPSGGGAPRPWRTVVNFLCFSRLAVGVEQVDLADFDYAKCEATVNVLTRRLW